MSISQSEDLAIIIETRSKLTLRFTQIAAVFIFLTTLSLLMLILADKVTASYQGDEGLRIYDAYQTALGYPGRLHTGIWNSFKINFAGFHPPGDSLVRSLIIKLADVLQVEANPIHMMFGVSLFAGIFSHYFMTLICYRASGLIAGFVSLFVFLSSYLMTEVRVSSTGEALAIPLMITGVYFLQSGLRAVRKSWRGVTLGGIFFLLSALVRPETAFVLPGLCLALWYVYGFKKATLFGAIAGSFDVFKMSRSIFSPNDDKLSLLNVGEKYFNKAHSFESFLKTDYFKTFQSEPNTAFVLTAILGGAYCLFDRSKRDIEHKTLVILYGCFLSYTGVVIVAQFLGLAPHASYRMAIVSTIFLIPIFAIVCRRIYVFLNSEKNKLSKLRHLEFTGYGTVIITLICGWSLYSFATDQRERVVSRAPEGLSKTVQYVLKNINKDDAVYIDRMRYWESGMAGYFSDRSAPFCQYARCQISMVPAQKYWGAQRKETATAGKKTWGEFNTLRMHTFIREEKPKFIIVANEEIHNDWYRIGTGFWKQDTKLWYSAIYPYLTENVNYKKLQPLFVRLGAIEDKEYFDDYAYLIPRHRSDIAIVYQAYYNRRPNPPEIEN